MVTRCRECNTEISWGTKYCSLKCHGIYTVKHYKPEIIQMYSTGQYSLKDIGAKFNLSHQAISSKIRNAHRLGIIDADKILQKRMCRLGKDFFSSSAVNMSRAKRGHRARKIVKMKRSMTFRAIGDKLNISQQMARKIYIKYLAGFYK